MFDFSVNVSVAHALQTLQENKQKHIQAYKEAMLGWEKAMEKFTVTLNNWAAEGGKAMARPQEPQKPKDYCDEYDKIIVMLQHHCGDTVALQEHDFERIIRNQFNWSDNFRVTNAMYTG